MNASEALLSFGSAVGWMVVGILISLVLPVAVKALQNKGRLEAAGQSPTLGARVAAAWVQYGGNRYLIVLVAAVVVAAVLVFVLNLQFHTPRDAALAGFGWESLVNKLFGSSPKA
jgi:hypothetical protein